jgi:anti-sigma factor RsiW
MSTTTHPFAPEEIMAFVDGELSADRAQSLSAHIDHCAECSEAAAAFRNTSHSLSNWRVAGVPTQLEERVTAALQKTPLRLVVVGSNGFLPIGRWAWKHWVFALGASAVVLTVLFAIATPSLLRSRMAANEASAIGRARARETARAMSVDTVRTDSSKVRGLDALTPAPSDVRSAEAILSQPMIARTVSLSIVVKDFDASRTSLDAILARHNGYAAGLNVVTPQGAARALQASLRIPAPQLFTAVAELKALGRVENETQGGEEVTQQHADLVTRLKNSRETERRLQDVLRTRTGKVKDVLEVEQEIARVRGEIEQMESEQQTLEHRVDFAAIDLKLAEEYKAQLTTPAPSVAMQLRNAIVNGFRSAFESILSLVLFFAESGPTLLLWLAVLFIPGRFLWRRYQRSLAAGAVQGV